MRIPTNIPIDNPAWHALQALVSYWGVTSAAGAATGLTFVCANLANEPSYVNQKIKLLGGLAAGQERAIKIHGAGGVETVDDPFTDNAGAAVTVAAGTPFVILSVGGGPSTGGSSQVLSFYGDVTTFTGVNNFSSTDLAGFGDDFFAGWWVYVLRDAAGGGAAPQGEAQLCTNYVSAGGDFTHGAFTAPLAVGDAVGLIHPAVMAYMITSLYTDGVVHFNDTDGIAGAAFPVGTAMQPSNDEASTLAIAVAYGLKKISVYSTVAGGFVVPDTMEVYQFVGQGHYTGMDLIDLNGQDVDACSFYELNITGIEGGGGGISLWDCSLHNATIRTALMRNCVIQVLALGANATIDGQNCSAWQGAATITLGTPNPCNLYGWKGDLTLDAQTGGITNIYSLGGTITIMNTCNGGTINIYGTAVVIDNSAVGCTVNDYTIDTRLNRQLFTLDYWSEELEEVQIDAAGVTVALPDITVAGLPDGAIVERSIVMFKFRMIENTDTAANNLNGATVALTSQVIQIRDDTPSAYVDGINFVDNLFNLAAGAREGGDVIIGQVNVSAVVDGNDTYNLRWLLGRADADNLNFNDCQVGLRIWYSI